MVHPANVDLHISDVGLDLIKEFEGWYPRAYYDKGGVLTIGWGTTNEGPNGKVVWPGRVIDKEQGTVYLRNDMLEHERLVKHYVKVPLNQNQFDALVSLCYNMGIGNLRKSPVMKELNRGNYDAVPGLIKKHNRGYNEETGQMQVWKGLVRRREAEAMLFMSPEAVAVVPLEHGEGSNIMATGAPERVPDAFMNTVKSETFQTQVVTWAGLAGTVGSSIEPLTSNPLLFGFVVLAAIGLAIAFYIKYRDTGQGR